MRIQEVGSRSVLFTFEMDWNLNIHLIKGDRYNYVIDTGLGAQSVAPVIEAIAGSGKPIVVINTHYHWDHIWGNAALGDAPICAHRLCREAIALNWDSMIERNSRYAEGKVLLRLPDITFDETLTFEADGIRLFHTPGHTTDSISVLDERDGVLSAGDNIGDTPEEMVPSLACERDTYLRTLRHYQELDFRFAVSGHNEVQGRDFPHRIMELL